MFEKILIPVDFSAASRKALRCANQLSEKCGSEQRIINVLTFVANKEQASRFLVRGADLLTVFRKELDDFIQGEPYQKRTADVLVNEHASVEILNHSKEQKCRLIVVGSHGHSTMINLLLGSIAQKLLRYSELPVMVIPRDLEEDIPLKFENILVPIDFSQISLRAVRLASEMAQQWGSTLHLLHVVDMEELKEAQKMAVPDSVKAEELDVRPTVQSIMKGMEFSGVWEVTTVQGDPADEILKYANRQGIDFIVMGSHGRKGLDRVLIGSTTASVIRNTRVPVITLSETPTIQREESHV